MTKLNQIVAIEKGVKSDSQGVLTRAYHVVPNPAPFTGIAREYTPADEEGTQLPPESTPVQLHVETVINEVETAVARMWDVVATKDETNRHAVADIVVDESTLALAVPVTTLLWLEKQVQDFATFVSKLPTLDPAKQWHLNGNTPEYSTNPVETTRSQKVPKAFVKYEATPEHPAQVDTYTEDVVIGTWATTHFSGAISIERQRQLQGRVSQLAAAIKQAREEANSIDVTDKKIGDDILGWLFA